MIGLVRKIPRESPFRTVPIQGFSNWIAIRSRSRKSGSRTGSGIEDRGPAHHWVYTLGLIIVIMVINNFHYVLYHNFSCNHACMFMCKKSRLSSTFGEKSYTQKRDFAHNAHIRLSLTLLQHWLDFFPYWIWVTINPFIMFISHFKNLSRAFKSEATNRKIAPTS